MPLYSATAPMTALYPGDSFTLASAESPTSGQFSVAFNIASNQFSNSGYAFSIEGIFSGSSGCLQLSDAGIEYQRFRRFREYRFSDHFGNCLPRRLHRTGRKVLSPELRHTNRQFRHFLRECLPSLGVRP
jgi:hypothetical protein